MMNTLLSLRMLLVLMLASLVKTGLKRATAHLPGYISHNCSVELGFKFTLHYLRFATLINPNKGENCNDGGLAMRQGTTENIFRVPSRNRS